MEYEVQGPRPRGRPKRTWREAVREDCQARKLNKEDAIDRCKWRKRIKDVRWSGWVWVGECFFWYRPTRVVPDKRLLNGCVCVCVCVCVCLRTNVYHRAKFHLKCSNICRDIEWLYFSVKTLVLNQSFRPKHHPDIKYGFKPKLCLTSVLAKSFSFSLLKLA